MAEMGCQWTLGNLLLTLNDIILFSRLDLGQGLGVLQMSEKDVVT